MIFPPGIRIEPGNEVVATVRWRAAAEQAVMTIKNLNTGVMRPVISGKNKPGLYNGGTVGFASAERVAKRRHGPQFELAKFTPFEMVGAEMLTAAGKWETVGEAPILDRYNLRESKEGSPTGNVMAETEVLGAGRSEFLTKWAHCHP